MQPPPGAPPGGWGAPPGAPPGGPPGRGPAGWSSPSAYGPPGGYGVGLPPGVNPQFGATGRGGQTEPMGIISLIVGLLSLPLYFCCGIFALMLNLIGLVLGFISISRVKSEPQRYSGNGIAIAALAVNALFLIINIVLLVFVFGLMGIGMLSGGGP